MEAPAYRKNEIKSWLQVCLSEENLSNLTVNLLGNSEKGDGFTGDVLFVEVIGESKKDGSRKTYNLVVKCSLHNEVLRNNSPMKEFFLNEIHVYTTLFPTFINFQLDRGIKVPFNSVPKCYGVYTDENREVIVFENLLKSDYYVWDKRKPLTKKHINLVIEEYAKFHAVSLAMSEQETQKYVELTQSFNNLFKKVEKQATGMLTVFANAVKEVCEWCKHDVDENILQKWNDFGERTESLFLEMLQDSDELKVVTHGDCWNNNYMFQSEGTDVKEPSKVSILDWQIARLSSPVCDLSHFLFACISGDDLQNLQLILEEYYESFSNYFNKLGCNADKSYPKDQFLVDWKQYSKFGIIKIPLVMKICYSEKEDTPDFAEAAESGGYHQIFQMVVRNKTDLKNRMKPIVKYVVENDLI